MSVWPGIMYTIAMIACRTLLTRDASTGYRDIFACKTRLPGCCPIWGVKFDRSLLRLELFNVIARVQIGCVQAFARQEPTGRA
jgi:hypothetical protein